MPQKNLFKHSSIIILSKKIRDKNIQPSDLIKYYLARIEKYNPAINSFITILKEQSLQEAEKVENELNKEVYRGILHGIPFSVKDMIAVENVRLTAGSKIFLTHISKSDSTIIKRLKKAGSIILGTNNLNEFAAGITGKNTFFGDTKNPLCVNRITGGSSGGSAAAVAIGLIPFALGTDTGGSVRVPSSLCGIVGFKPTYNSISTTGVYKLSPSLDHIGIMAKNSMDIAIVFSTIKRQQRKFPNYVNKFEEQEIPSLKSSYKVLKNKESIVIGIPDHYFLDYLEHGIKSRFGKFVYFLESDKCHFVSTAKINSYGFFHSWQVVRLFEAYGIHKNIMKKKIGYYGLELRNQLLKGAKIKLKDYSEALMRIKKIQKQFSTLYTKIDFLVLPTTIISAPLISQCKVKIQGKLFSVRRALLRNTFIFNSIGFPALTIPFGYSFPSNMPIGIQIIGKPYDDYRLLMFGNYLEKYHKVNSNNF
jgi:aspartyl-tRNA(Asn)/glutamyl-tRNA(Gln) amidotransferase subunit A